MSIEAPTNCWTSSEQAIADAVANSARFQQIVGVSNATDATALVFGEQIADPETGETYDLAELQNLKHYAQVYSADENPYGKRRSPTSRFEPFGSVILFIERLVTDWDQNATDAPESVHRWSKNRAGDVVDQIISYLDDNGGPFIRTVVVTDGPGLNSREKWKTQGMWQGIEFTIDWGLLG